MPQISGYIKKYLFENKENSYRVAVITQDLHIETDKIVIVGRFPRCGKYELCLFEGDFMNHPRYGKQFVISSFKKVLPSDKEALVKFLSQRKYGALTIAQAEELYDLFADQALMLIRENPHLLEQTSIPMDKAERLVFQLHHEENYQLVMELLLKSGLRYREIDKAVARLGDNFVEVLNHNPYLLLKDADVDFAVADNIAKGMEVATLDDRRISALMKYIIERKTSNTGDTYLPYKEFLNIIGEYIDVANEQFVEVFQQVLASGEIVLEDDKITLSSLYEAENSISEILLELNEEATPLPLTFAEIAPELDFSCSPEQQFAIEQALVNPVSIITGGPGTGKTTIIKALKLIYEKCSLTTAIVAPTGRAAKRLKEVSGGQAETIHRLLGWDLHTNIFSKNYDEQCLIVDETSMVDVQLLSNLLEQSLGLRRVVLVGDKDQLSSVSPGNVLCDLIESDCFAITRLKTIFRQQKGSAIIALAEAIKNNEVNQRLFDKEVMFYPWNDQIIAQLVRDRDLHEFQVIAPVYQGSGGINHLNIQLQQIFNPPSEDKKEIVIDGVVFREKDKVLQLKNQTDDEVYNGDIGFIDQIEVVARRIHVRFDDNIVVYQESTFHHLRHGYCISIHKGQGSEFSNVIYVCLKNGNRNSVYTACTRAKEELIICGSFDVFIKSCKYMASPRKTQLVNYLRRNV